MNEARLLLVTILYVAAPLLGQVDNSLQQELQKQYPVTTVNAGGSVLESQAAFVLEKRGLRVFAITGDCYWPNSYKKGGHIRQPIVVGWSEQSGNTTTLLVHYPGSASVTRTLEVSEKVYVTAIESRNGDVVFHLQSCGVGAKASGQNGPPERARLSFHFSKTVLTMGDLPEIEDTINEVLRNSADEDNAYAVLPPQVSEGAQASTENEQAEVIHFGMTKDEVTALIGNPERIEKFRDRFIYQYKGFKITFANGTVRGVE